MPSSKLINTTIDNNHHIDDRNDEIDILELIKIIWSYKWLTVIMCAIAITGSVLYAFNAQEWWVARAEVSKPQLKDVYSFYRYTQELSSIIDTPDTMNILSKPENMFSLFVELFDMPLNKNSFLKSSTEVLNHFKKRNVENPVEGHDGKNKLNLSLYLMDRQQDIAAKKNNFTRGVSLSFKSETQESSLQLLNAYINYINEKVKVTLYEELLLLIDIHKQHTIIAIDTAKKAAKAKLDLEIKKAEYAYNIASNANIDTYQAGLDNKTDLFHINLGAKVLKEKIKFLKLFADDLGVLDPEISKMQIILNKLNSFTISKTQNFIAFRYLDTIEPPLARTAPKKSLIVILATLLTAMLSIFIALAHNFIKNSNKHEAL